MNKPLSGLLIYQRIMPSAESLSSKFHSCPRNFASRPTVHFFDNLSALGIILRYTSRRKGFIYLLTQLSILLNRQAIFRHFVSSIRSKVTVVLKFWDHKLQDDVLFTYDNIVSFVSCFLLLRHRALSFL